MLSSSSGRLILDAISRPKRKPFEIPITVSVGDNNGNIVCNSMKKPTTKQYMLNMATGDLEEVHEPKIIASNQHESKRSKVEEVNGLKLNAKPVNGGYIQQQSCFSIFGIPVNGAQLWRELDPLSPEQMRSETSEPEPEQTRFGFESWVDVFSEFERSGHVVSQTPKKVPEVQKDLQGQTVVAMAELPKANWNDAKLLIDYIVPPSIPKKPVETFSVVIEEINKNFMFHTLVVKHAKNLEKFSLQREPSDPVSQDALEFLQGMTECYHDYVTEGDPECLTSKELEIHKFYACFIRDTGLWARVFVIHFEASLGNEDRVYVLLIDEGSEQWVDAKYIQPLFKDFATLPMQTFPAKLQMTRKDSTVSSWSEDDMVKFRNDVEGRRFVCGIFGKTMNVLGEIPILNVGLIDEGTGDHDQSFYTFGDRLKFELH